MWIAGPASSSSRRSASERVGNQDCVRDKDALDVVRLLQATDTADLATRLGLLRRDSVAADATSETISILPELFGSVDTEGVAMAVGAAGTGPQSDVLAASLVALAEDLLYDLRDID
jgi:hypothetical protein